MITRNTEGNPNHSVNSVDKEKIFKERKSENYIYKTSRIDKVHSPLLH